MVEIPYAEDYVRFKLPYCGSRQIFNLHAYLKDDDYVYYGKKFTPTEYGFVDDDGVVYVYDRDGYLVEKKI